VFRGPHCNAIFRMNPVLFTRPKSLIIR